MALRPSVALRPPIVFCVLALALGAEAAPEICDVAVTFDSGSGAIVTWSGGTPPFLIVRGNAARFDRASELTYFEQIREHRYADSSVREPDRRYYYQVYDNFSARELFSGPEHAHDEGHEPAGPPQGRIPECEAPRSSCDREPGHDDETPPPDNNYCRGVLRRPATWK